MRVRQDSPDVSLRSSRPSRNEVLLTVAVLATLAASGTAQPQFAEFARRGLPTNGDRTQAVAVGDVDGDGDLDIVVGNGTNFYSLPSQNRLYLNDGHGNYTDVTATRMPIADDDTLAIAMGDVDGDGDIDMVLGNGYDPERNKLYLNDGTGVFEDASVGRLPPIRAHTHAVVLGDVDGDGDLDIVFGNGPTYYYGLPRSPGQNRLYLNDGQGAYTDATQLLPFDNDHTQAVKLGDVDGDGDLDLVLGNGAGAEQNRLYLNDGSGGFEDETAERLPAYAEATGDLALGDVDGDGDLDVIFANDPVYWYGVLQSPGQDRLYLNIGDGTYIDVTATRMPVDNHESRSVVMGDVDEDGDLDLVTGVGGAYGTRGAENRLYLNDGGTYSDVTAGRVPPDVDVTYALVSGDMDGDGDLDIVVGNTGENRVYANDGAGAFADATHAHVPLLITSPFGLALGDVDGDGDPDLVLGNRGSGEQNRLYVNDGTGFFADETAARMPVDQDPTHAVALGDVDGDGDIDIVFGNQQYLGLQNRLYLNDGTGTYTDVTSARMPTFSDSTADVALGDVDGDGDLDMVVGNFVQRRLYINDGTGNYTDATAARMPLDWDDTNAVALGDVDGDGDLDMVFGNGSSVLAPAEQNRLYLNDGLGTFTDATATRMPADGDYTVAAALGDVDGDGDLDIVFGNATAFTSPEKQNKLYLNDGDGTYTDVTETHLPFDNEDTLAVALGDVDGDGDVDIVFGNVRGNSLYVNDGSGAYTDASNARLAGGQNATTRAVVLGDTDGDEDVDLLFGNDQDLVRFNFNLLRHLRTPLEPRIGRKYRIEAYARYGPPSPVDVAVPFISAARASIPFPPLGTIGIDPTQMAALRPFIIPQPAGIGMLDVQVPNLPGLFGAASYIQAVLVQDPFSSHLTNVVGGVIMQ